MNSIQVAALLCAIETPAERKHAFLATLHIVKIPLGPDNAAAQEKYWPARFFEDKSFGVLASNCRCDAVRCGAMRCDAMRYTRTRPLYYVVCPHVYMCARFLQYVLTFTNERTPSTFICFHT